MSATAARTATEVVVRPDLDFGLDDTIPRHWFAGDPFKTRLFDALSALFPEGERFFIESVRHYRDQLASEDLRTHVRAFMRQEGQHGKAHAAFNEHLRAQGVDIDGIERGSRQAFAFIQRHCSARYAIALTAATEHLTALLAEVITSDTRRCEHAHPAMRALFVWHAMEEYEHKAVAYDVMLEGARVGYGRRALAMVQLSLGFPLHVALVVNHLLKVDGYGLGRRLRLWGGGLWWLWGWRGLLWPIIGPYLAYYRPSFHPATRAPLHAYGLWRGEFDRHQDPRRADRALFAAKGTPRSTE